MLFFRVCGEVRDVSESFAVFFCYMLIFFFFCRQKSRWIFMLFHIMSERCSLCYHYWLIMVSHCWLGMAIYCSSSSLPSSLLLLAIHIVLGIKHGYCHYKSIMPSSSLLLALLPYVLLLSSIAVWYCCRFRFSYWHCLVVLPFHTPYGAGVVD